MKTGISVSMDIAHLTALIVTENAAILFCLNHSDGPRFVTHAPVLALPFLNHILPGIGSNSTYGVGGQSSNDLNAKHSCAVLQLSVTDHQTTLSVQSLLFSLLSSSSLPQKVLLLEPIWSDREIKGRPAV